MQRTISFLQEFLQTVSSIQLTVIPFTEKALTDCLQKLTGFASNESAKEWSAIRAQLLQAARCEYLRPDGSAFLLCLRKESRSLLVLGPTQQENMDILRRTGVLITQYLSKLEQPEQMPFLSRSNFSGDVDISKMRQVEQRYEYSAALTDAVQQGNLSLAMHLVGGYDPNLQTAVRNSNPLRNAQNYCIVLNTQLRHALENTGIHPYQVDRLSNEIGLEIEQLKNISQLPDFFNGVVRRYCRLVQEHAYPNLKPLTNLAVTYIKEHLADNLTVKDTAKALTVNANYLSSLFHKDMGMTFIDFVNKERTQQAAALLRHTNLQIQQIASTVGYNNTSYFAKQFVRFHGISPSHYRREI